MSPIEKAKQEINSSLPYILLLSKKNITKNIRKELIKAAPTSFYSVISQISRHIINNRYYKI